MARWRSSPGGRLGPVLLAAFAHPDDETFAIGATLARHAALGGTAALYVATDGDAGRSGGVAASGAGGLARIRREELRRAADVLGVGHLVTPGFPDGALQGAPEEEVLGTLVAAIRTVRPAVVVTFGPEGAPTGHRDHRAISRYATAAFFLAANPTLHPAAGPAWRTARLYYVSWPFERPTRAWPIAAVPLTAAVDVAAWRDRKRLAFVEHRTQRELAARFEDTVTERECFALAAGVPQPRPVVEDLFEGLPAAWDGAVR